MKIGIIVALDSELDSIKKLFSECIEQKDKNNDFFIGTVGKHEIILTKSGIGKVCAAARTLSMISELSPDCIINTGLAGGIDVNTEVCDVIIGKDIVYHDVWCGEGCEIGQIMGYPLTFHSDDRLVTMVLSEKSELDTVRIYSGMICSGDRFITDGKELQNIKGNFPEGIAVDMESAAIAHICYMKNIPFLSLRIISDTPGKKDNIEQYNNFWSIAPKQSFDILKRLIEKL
ncbi:MAG: 5'-methylthioadenosine/adenosylhomocysteine nucleosidase [Bacteroidales bacterium]